MSINEAAVPTGVAARKINQLLDDEVRPDSAAARVASKRGLHACAVPMVSFGATDGSRPSKGVRLDAMRQMERYAKECRRQLWRDPGSASGLRFDGGGITISPGKRATWAKVGLAKWADSRERVVEDPDVRSGMPVLRGTRAGVYEAADALAGDGSADALKCLPSPCGADLEAAAPFANVCPGTRRSRSKDDGRRLIDRQIADAWKHADAEAEDHPLACNSPRFWLRPNGRQPAWGDDS